MKQFKITTANRGAARRLLNTWLPSVKVRTMSLHDLQAALTQQVAADLISNDGVERALGKRSDQSNNADEGRGDDKDDIEGGDQSDSGGGAEKQESDSNAYTQGYDDGVADRTPRRMMRSSAQAAYDRGYQAGSDATSGKSNSDGDKSGDGDESEDDSNESESEDEQEQEQEQEDEDEYATDESEPIRHEKLDVIKKYVTANIPVMLIGPTGCGKSFLAEQVARELELDYYCTGSVFAKYDLIGYVNQVTDKYHGTPAFEAHTKGGLYCQDEMDASNAAALVAFNALNDKQTHFTWPCGTMPKHSDYRAIGTANTWCNGATADYVGRNKLDGATVNRFVRVYVDYDKRVERRIGTKDICERVWSIREACETLGIRHILSTRSIDHATVAQKAGVQRICIDRDILFAGLDDSTVKQIKSHMRSAT